jgi:signal transduction histidine kinase
MAFLFFKNHILFRYIFINSAKIVSLMGKLIFLIFALLGCHQQPLYAQYINVDSLIGALNSSVNDSVKFEISDRLFHHYLEDNLDSSMIYAKQIYQLSLQSSKKKQYSGLERMGVLLWRIGSTEKSIELLLDAMHISEELGDSILLSYAYFDLANAYNNGKDYERAIFYYSKALHYAIDEASSTRPFMMLGTIYLERNQLDSAEFYAQKSYGFYANHTTDLPNFGTTEKYLPVCLNLLGKIAIKSERPSDAMVYFRRGINEGFAYSNFKAVSDNYISIAKLFNLLDMSDSAYYFARLAYAEANRVNSPYSVEETSRLLKDLFREDHIFDSAFKYQEIMVSAGDSIFSLTKARMVESLSFAEVQRQRDLESAQIQFRNTIKLFALLAALLGFFVIVLILYRNNRHKQKVNKVLEETLANLKAAQSQLVQSEKMASLGALVAGIAHEIQNPLNFVNNFSEVNVELLDELDQETQNGNLNRVKHIAEEIRENELKINNHGKRADAIVKGMLQHSRSNTGQKELTDINALADEYLRLAYHGLRAKEKSSNASMQTKFDLSIGLINVVPQEIGRVLLNLYNNAFYAIAEKEKTGMIDYDPTVWVSTKKTNGKVEITVKDNGLGINKSFLEKIFQPFFTTKPAGQGTGLGLSLSYDIVKAHGGEIRVETQDGEGATFVVELPLGRLRI